MTSRAWGLAHEPRRNYTCPWCRSHERHPEVARVARADVIINPVVGPEVVTGSTRMKAGTATKLALNTLTTAAMIRAGKVYGNLMVDLRATNEKLRERSERIVMEIAGVARRKARRILDAAAGRVKVAVVMQKCGLPRVAARRRLRDHGGSLRGALEERPERGRH